MYTHTYTQTHTCTHTESPLIKDPVYPSLPINGFVDRTERRNVVIDVGFNVSVTAGAALSLECDLRNSGVPPVTEIRWSYQGQRA